MTQIHGKQYGESIVDTIMKENLKKECSIVEVVTDYMKSNSINPTSMIISAESMDILRRHRERCRLRNRRKRASRKLRGVS